MANAIEFENVSKQYRLGLVGTGTLAHDIRRFWVTNILRQEDPYLKIGETNDRASKGNSEYVWALRDITFNVEQGDVVGIIGKNGAGKSTLLKLLSRVTGPTTGQIRAHGRIGSLLEVGTGFHAEMTGRENIFMNGAILGMTHNEIQRKLDEIIDFSGCERYIDTPVKRYSSGMMVRLGFAVAAHLDPEILVVDEVLAVGDAEFQKKAIGKMQDVSKGEGRTVLFVSHNMASVKALCHNGILLEKGGVKYMGEIRDVVATYLQDNENEIVNFSDTRYSHHIGESVREIEYTSVKMLNKANEIASEEVLEFEMHVHRNNPNIEICQFGIVVRTIEDNVVGANYSHVVELPKGPENMLVHLKFPNHKLAKGKYKLNFNISRFEGTANVHDYDIVEEVIRFEVTHIDAFHNDAFFVYPFPGTVRYNEAIISVESLL